PPPPPLSDRFEPNDTVGTLTDLGRVVTRDLPKLAIAPGDEDWFRVQAAATGNLTITATPATPGDSVRLELRDASGATVLTTGTAVQDAARPTGAPDGRPAPPTGQIIGQSLAWSSPSGQTYLVHVLPGPEAVASTPTRYTLRVQSLTANLGTQ